MVDIFGATSNTNWITQLKTTKEIKNVYYDQVEEDVFRVVIELKHAQHWGYSIYYDTTGKRLVVQVKRQPAVLDIKKLKIAIDAGHGGDNSGASGLVSKVLEKEYTLKIAKQLQLTLQKAVNSLSNIAPVIMSTDTHELIDLLAGAKQAVDALKSIGNSVVGIHREYRVLVAIDEQQRARRDQSCNSSPRPTVGIDHEHAVAMPIDHTIGYIRLQIGHSANRHCHFHPFVGGGNPERGRTPTTDPGHGNSIRVDVAAADQIIDSSDAVPALNACRGVAPRMPPPAIAIIGSMVHRCDLAQLQCIDDQTDVAMPRQPDPV